MRLLDVGTYGPALGTAAAEGTPEQQKILVTAPRERASRCSSSTRSRRRSIRRNTKRSGTASSSADRAAACPATAGHGVAAAHAPFRRHASASARAAARPALDRARRREPAAEHAGPRHGAHAAARRLPRQRCTRSIRTTRRIEGYPCVAEPRRSADAARSRRAVGAQRAARGDARRGDRGRRAVRGDLRVRLPRRAIARRRSRRGSPPWRAPPGCRSAAAIAWASTTISTRSGSAASRARASRGPARSRSSPIPAACSARSRTTIRGLRFALADLAGPGADDHRRRLHRLRARPAGGEGRSASFSKPRAIPAAFARRSTRRPSAAFPSSRSRSDAPRPRPRRRSRTPARWPAATSPTRRCSTATASIRVETLDELACTLLLFATGRRAGAARSSRSTIRAASAR